MYFKNIKSCKSPSKVKVQRCCTWVRLCCLFNLHVSLVLDCPHCLDFWKIFVKHCGFWEHFEKWNFYENSNQLRWYFYTSLFYYSADPRDRVTFFLWDCVGFDLFGSCTVAVILCKRKTSASNKNMENRRGKCILKCHDLTLHNKKVMYLWMHL